MKIAFMVGEFPSLSETFILNQITGLIDLGHDVEIFAFEGSFTRKIHPDVLTYNLKNRTHYFNIPSNRIKRIIKALILIVTNFYKYHLMILKSLNIYQYGKCALSLELLYVTMSFFNEKFDIIYCHFGTIGNIGACLKQIGIKGKLLTVFYGADIRTGIIKGKDFYKNLFDIGDYFFAYTKFHIKTLAQFGVNPKKIIFHPLGIYTDEFYSKLPNIVNKNSKFKIVTVARLVKEKGLSYGILAIRELLNNNPDINISYLIIGSGPLKNSLKKLVVKLDLVKIVHFLGPMTRQEIVQTMAKSHLFLLPSVSETFGVVLLEAQSMCLPVLATRIGGVSEALVDGKSGFLVPIKDIKNMAKKIEYLMKNQKVRLAMGKFGRKFVKDYYDINKLNPRLGKIFQKIAAK